MKAEMISNQTTEAALQSMAQLLQCFVRGGDQEGPALVKAIRKDAKKDEDAKSILPLAEVYAALWQVAQPSDRPSGKGIILITAA